MSDGETVIITDYLPRDMAFQVRAKTMYGSVLMDTAMIFENPPKPEELDVILEDTFSFSERRLTQKIFGPLFR